MTTFARVMVLVMWLVGVFVSGPALQWTAQPDDPAVTAERYTVGGALHLTLHEEQVALRLGTVGVWQVEVVAAVPPALAAAVPQPAVAERHPDASSAPDNS